MMKRTKLCTSLMIAFGSGIAAMPAMAQTAPATTSQQLERVEITGSAIKRIGTEGSLPVTVLTTEDIQKTGATSVSDLIQMLPQMQGFVPSSNSVNGGGGGVTTAALHSLPSKYTLVLLDGQRVAPLGVNNAYGGGFGVNLESIPIAAIERIEILTDGASATYGSDAIAGVVNFITKKNRTDGDISLTFDKPQHPGARSWNASITKGFGDLDTDHFNILFSGEHDEQEKLSALQRPFSAKGAYFPFSSNGTNYIFNARTSNTEPANLTFNAVPTGSPAGTTPTAYAINPYYALHGNCGNALAGAVTDPAVLGATGVSCRFNYAATVEDLPSIVRDSGFLKGTLKLGSDMTLWSSLTASDTRLTAQYAPSAQPLPVSPTKNAVLYNNYVVPYLNANDLSIVGSAKMGYRSVSIGGRTDDYETEATHFALGLDGNVKGWDYNARITLSRARETDTAAGGYTDFNLFASAVANGTYDPVLGTGQSALGSAILNSQFSKTVSDLNTLHVGAQHDLWDLSGGTAIIGLGADYTRQHYTISYSDLILSQSGFSTQPASPDYPVGGNYGQVPFDASRNNYGAFAELYLPVLKQFEVTASVRYDTYSKTHSNYQFGSAVDPVTGLQNQTANADLGDTFSKATGKISFRYIPVQSVLFRGSYGTGFKAPNISDIAGAVTFSGSTIGSYPCPFPGSAGCFPGSAQYDLLAGPNGLSGSAGLKPETSKQWSLGFRVDPLKGLSMGLDLWDVKIRNQVLSQGIAEQVGFANPTQYSSLFINPYQDPAGFTTIGFQQLPFNGGQAQYEGIDWDVGYVTRLNFGNLGLRWTGTQILKQQYNFGPGLPYNSDLGVFGPDQQVVFRTTMNFSASLETGAFVNTVIAHFKSGYKDASYPKGTDIFLANADGTPGATTAFSGIHVPSYTTIDWQGKYNYSKSIALTIGVKNVFDRDPPLSLQSGGGGNQVGYDARYTDPIGRQFYVTGQYKF